MKLDKEKFRSDLFEFYKDYYQKQLGLKDWVNRSHLRENEEEVFGRRVVNWTQEVFGFDYSDNAKVLVVGCGTGAEVCALHSVGAEVYGVDVNPNAVAIAREALRFSGLSIADCNHRIQEARAEDLPFSDEMFDYVICYTVLEHVADVGECLREMLRTKKREGLIYICIPDYGQLYEGHYKLPLPMFLPKIFSLFILILAGRPARFLGTLNVIKPQEIQRWSQEHDLIACRYYLFDGVLDLDKRSICSFLISLIRKFLFDVFGSRLNQHWVLLPSKRR